MSIIAKFLWTGLTQKKARTFLVIFSIAVSAALIFANEGFRSTVSKMFYEADTRNAGNSDIRITTKEAVGSPIWIDTEILDQYREQLVYSNAFIREDALYAPNVEDMYYYRIFGVDMEEFQQHNPFALKKGSFQDWKGYKLIMGEVYSEIYGFTVGDTIALEMNGRIYDFTVAGIANQEGVYMRELADGGTLFAPKETIAEIFKGRANLIYIKVKDKGQLEHIYHELSKALPQYDVQYTIDTALITSETANYALPFRVASIAVIFMSMFIIFTGFGLITNERISSFGTLRSLGMSRKRLNRILMLESSIVGACGGLIGCGIGMVVLKVIKDTYFKNNGTFTTGGAISFGLREMLTAIITAVLITCASAIWSIRRTTRLTIKEIILHRPEQKITKASRLWIVGALLLFACAIVPRVLSINIIGMILGYILVTGALIGLVLVLPALAGILAEIGGRLGLSQEGYLGIRNCKDNKALANNLKLFAALIAIVAFMISIFNTMSYDLEKAWKENNLYEVRFTLRDTNKDSLNQAKAVEGVSKAIAFYENYDCEEADTNLFFNVFYGIEDSSFFEMNVVGDMEQAQEAMKALNEGNNMITTNIIKEKLGLKLGDFIKIRYGDRVEKFKVTGFVDTNLGIGHVAYISGDNYRKFIGVNNYDCFMVQGNIDSNTLKLNLKRRFTKNILSIETKEELKKSNADKVESIFKAVNIYTYFAVAIGILGMMNNIIAGFLERKQSLALYRCIGMSKKGMSKMLLIEAVTIGVLGSIMGVVTGIIMMNTIPQAVGVMWGNVTPKPAMTEITILSIAGLLSMFFISILPLKSSAKISILESMKYE